MRSLFLNTCQFFVRGEKKVFEKIDRYLFEFHVQFGFIIIIIIIIIINSNSVDTRWQWLFYMYTEYDIGYC
jgi:hypothetical protein